MKRLYMSGYTGDLLGQNGVLEAGVTLVKKPFTKDALLRKVRGVLDAEKAQSRATAR